MHLKKQSLDRHCDGGCGEILLFCSPSIYFFFFGLHKISVKYYFPKCRRILHFRSHHAQKEVNNIDIRTVDEYVEVAEVTENLLVCLQRNMGKTFYLYILQRLK